VKLPLVLKQENKKLAKESDVKMLEWGVRYPTGEILKVFGPSFQL
jgi:hypothetical protein